MRVKTLALATTSFVAICLAAQTGTAGGTALGSVNLGTGHTWQDQCDSSGGECGASGDIDDQFMNIHGGATVYAPYDANWGLQFGFAADAAFANEEDDNNYATGVSLFSQIAFYDKQHQFSTFAVLGRSSSIDEDTASFFAAGFGAQWFCDQWTFAAQLGYLDAFDNQNGGSDDEFFHEAGFVRALVAYYASDRLKLSGNLAYADGAQDSDDDAVLWEWGAGVEYLFSPKMPASVYLEYRGVDAEESCISCTADQTDSHRVDVGIRVLFNAPDLMTSDRTGGTNNLPAFHRWVSEAGEQID